MWTDDDQLVDRWASFSISAKDQLPPNACQIASITAGVVVSSRAIPRAASLPRTPAGMTRKLIFRPQLAR